MAYTTVISGTTSAPNLRLDRGDGHHSPNPYFHPADITLIMGHPDAMAIQMVNAMDPNDQEIFVLVALHTIPPPDVTAGPAHRIVDTTKTGEASGLAGLPCPPHNREGEEKIDPLD